MVKESIKSVAKGSAVDSISRELKVYSIDDLVTDRRPKVKALFENLQSRLLSLGEDVTEVPQKHYLAYKRTTNFADLVFMKSEIRVTLNLKSGELEDPKGVATDFTKPKKGHWGNGDYEIVIREQDDIAYSMLLVEQAYKKQSRQKR